MAGYPPGMAAWPPQAPMWPPPPGVPMMAPPGMPPPGMAPPGMAPPNMAPPNMAPPGMAPPNMAPPNMAPPNMAPPPGQPLWQAGPAEHMHAQTQVAGDAYAQTAPSSFHGDPYAAADPPLYAPPSEPPPEQYTGPIGPPEILVAYTREPVDPNEVALRTVIGEYEEVGGNIGRKVFRKVMEKTPSIGLAAEVCLYYWDGRDGPTFQGWWFGNQVGGSMVWGHCVSDSPTVPSTGWKIPWDGNIRPTFLVEDKAEQERLHAHERLLACGQAAQEASAAAKMALAEAKGLHGGVYSSMDKLEAAEQVLQPVHERLTEALRMVEAEREACALVRAVDSLRQLAQMRTLVTTSQAQVTGELNKVRGGRAQVTYQREQLEAHEAIAEVAAKLNLAEGVVTRATHMASLVDAAGEDIDRAKEAVSQTEQAVADAQLALAEVHGLIASKEAHCRNFQSELMKKQAAVDLAKLRGPLQVAEGKLEPLRNIRNSHQQRVAAQRFMQDMTKKLEPAEVNIDEAEQAVLVLAEECTKDTIQRADEVLATAEGSLAKALKAISDKKATVSGLIKDELGKLEARAEASRLRLAALRERCKESSEKVLGAAQLVDATERLQAVAEKVEKAMHTEGPFLMGLEELPLKETLAAVKAGDVALISANTSISIARMFIATKLLEAKQFTEANSRQATAKLRDLQQQLDDFTKRLTDLKTKNTARKTRAFLTDTEALVLEVESAAKAVAEATAGMEDEATLLELDAAHISKAAAQATKAEAVVAEKGKEARKLVTARQAESKDAAPEDLAAFERLAERLSTALTETSRLRKLAIAASDRREALQALKSAQEGLEEHVQRAGEVAEALQDQAKTPEQIKEAETQAGECRAALDRLIRNLRTVRHSDSRAAADALRGQVQAAQDKLDAAVRSRRRPLDDGGARENGVPKRARPRGFDEAPPPPRPPPPPPDGRAQWPPAGGNNDGRSRRFRERPS